MVVCLKCLRTLPYSCICDESLLKKLERYYKQCLREIKLIEAVESGYTPKIRVTLMDSSGNVVRDEVYDADVERIDVHKYKLSLHKIPVARNTTMIITILDADENPLYKYESYESFGGEIDFCWWIGFPKWY